ncbi:hypothetical protein Cni_G20241 [Canna indica]|uniref:Uncharacterized protein n=1 Tax=Canna indica TaxID=4628 RepID=A0AAQ3KMA5_9LILI|nr:hypothetical protein Cni_G20241 [Canna indica]
MLPASLPQCRCLTPRYSFAGAKTPRQVVAVASVAGRARSTAEPATATPSPRLRYDIDVIASTANMQS